MATDPAPGWLKLAVITAAGVAIVLVALAFRSSGSTNSTATSDASSLRSVAIDYCITKANLLAAIQADVATDPSTFQQASPDRLKLMQDEVDQLQGEASRAGDAGDSALGSELDDLAQSLQDVHDAIESNDMSKAADASARVPSLVIAVNNSAPVQAQCP